MNEANCGNSACKFEEQRHIGSLGIWTTINGIEPLINDHPSQNLFILYEEHRYRKKLPDRTKYTSCLSDNKPCKYSIKQLDNYDY